MDPYASEKEQIDAIRVWWRENGKGIVVGVVLGLAGLFGWRMWQDYSHNRSEQASFEYARMSAALAQGKNDAARQWARQITVDYGSTSYGTLAAFAIARIDMDQGDAKAAGKRLQWAFEHTGDEGLRRLAALRLARVQISEGKLDAADKTLHSTPPGGFTAAFSQVEGDLYVARGDTQKARAAYGAALKALSPGAPVRERQLLKVKLGNLGGAPAAQGTS
ncbi:MAG TPA: tetratricopeptide repeat protein [Chromatiales bacterium]|nr:tetratricopeptide repeat protein [Chromatiales bacterium]